MAQPSLRRLLRASRLPACLASAVFLVAASPAPTSEILPHRAIYALELSQQRSGAGISGVDGQMFFKWEDVCDAWIIEQRYQMSFLYSHGGDAAVQTSYATWESKDGLAFTFNLKRETNGVVEDEYRGAASLQREGGGTARYRVPDDREVELPPGTFFPTTHSLELLRLAAAGETFFAATMFDGTEDAGLTELSAVIGQPEAAGADVPPALQGLTAWPVEMAFFEVGGTDSTPVYEVSVRLYANGVIDVMDIDYGDFVIRATLQDLEPLAPPDC